MSTSSFESHSDIIDLQQQVARLQALLEISRQVHAAVRTRRSVAIGSAGGGEGVGNGWRSRHRAFTHHR